MTLESDIAALVRQEEKLRFTFMSEDDAWRLGSRMRNLADERKLPLVIEIKMGQRLLFHTALQGTAADNAEWARRKANAVLRFGKSSYRIGREHEKRGALFDWSRGIDIAEHAMAGGGFPIHLIGTGIIGTVCVSGIPQRQDHEFVVEALCGALDVSYPSIRLPDES